MIPKSGYRFSEKIMPNNELEQYALAQTRKRFALMSEAARLNLVEMTVSELSAALKRTVEDAYGYVRVRGELGNVKYHTSGHVYLDLKDEKACLAGVIWRMTASRIRIK